MSDKLKPITKEDFYMHYLAYGGDIELLPEPFTKKEEYLYLICIEISKINGGGGSSINVIDNLLSTSAVEALSANMGRILNEKIPEKYIVKLSEDTMNDGLGVKWSDNEYERIVLKNTPTIGNSIKLINVKDNGEITLTLNNGKTIVKTAPYIYNQDLDIVTGELNTYKSNDTIKSINLKDYIISLNNNIESIQEVDFTHYYKIEDELKIEITEEEFNNMQCVTKYYKEIDGYLVEITEEEFYTI